MKKVMIFAVVLLSFQSVSQARQVMADHGEAIGLSYVGTMIFTGVYASTGAGVAAAVGTTTSGVITTKDKESRKKSAKLILNDIQDYYQVGAVSLNLQTTINNLKNADETLSDAEALDLLNTTALSILEE
jgi:hypothetical protein